MKDDELNILLSEILTELKEVNKDKELELLTLESIHAQVGSIDDQLEKIPTKTPEINLDKLLELLKNSHNEIKKVIQNQPKEVIHEKRILLYPEGQGKPFLESIIRWFIVGLVTLVAIYLVGNIIAQYVIENSENKKYNIAYQWVYINQTEKNQKYLQKELLLIQNDSIRAIRVKEIKKYFK